MKRKTDKATIDTYGSWCYTKEHVRDMDTTEIKRHIKRHFRWSQGKGEYNDHGIMTPDKHKPMPYSPSTFRMLVCEALNRISK